MPDNAKNKCLKYLEKTYCRLQVSQIHGIGVFAIRDIPKGESVFYGSPKQEWLLFSKKELDNLDQEVKKMIDDFFASNKKGNIFMPKNGLNSIDISFFLNYSDKPNCQSTNNDIFIATRKIKKGEELTADYADYDSHFKKLKKFENLAL